MAKQKLLLTIFLLGFFAVNAQHGVDILSSGPKQMYLKYMQNHSTYKTAGWLLLGTGVAVFSAVYLSNAANGFNGPTQGDGGFIFGIIASAVSPALFILAGVNKRKASLTLKGERLTSVIMFHRTYYPAVSLSINL